MLILITYIQFNLKMSNISNQNDELYVSDNKSKIKTNLEYKYTKDALSEVKQYDALLNTTISKIIRHYNQLQLADHTVNTIKSGNDMVTAGIDLLRHLKISISTLETLLSDCSDFVKEIKEDLSCPRKSEDYIYLTKGGMLSYPGRDLLITQKEKTNVVKKQDVGKNTKKDKIYVNELKYHLKMPVVNNLKQIPPAMYYLKEDSSKTNSKNNHKSGIYINLGNENYAKIPFPEIVDSKKEYDRKHSIRCKYTHKKDCEEQRKKMSKYHNSQIRNCNFAHKGDKLVKIGYPSRCPTIPNYGNPESIDADTKHININDIKNLLMYGLNDLISAMIWMDYNSHKEQVFVNLESA